MIAGTTGTAATAAATGTGEEATATTGEEEEEEEGTTGGGGTMEPRTTAAAAAAGPAPARATGESTYPEVQVHHSPRHSRRPPRLMVNGRKRTPPPLCSDAMTTWAHWRFCLLPSIL